MIAGPKPYSEMRDSAVAWLGEVPSHWEITRVKPLLRRVQRPVEDGAGVVTCFRDGVVTLRSNRRTAGFTEALKEIGYQGIRKGDLVIHAMDAFAGAIGVSDSDGKGSPVYAVCEPSPLANARYFSRVAREMARSGWILALAKGIRERSTDFRYYTFAAQHVPLPPVDEQVAIVRFLDHTDRRIGRSIVAKQKMIRLLEEQKAAIVHQAVTRGLNPDAPMKPSGLDWLGDIPAHWGTRRVKYLLRERDVRSEDGSEEHLSMSQKLGLVPSAQSNEKRFLSESYAGGKLCDEGDIVLNRLKAHLGVFAVSPQSGVVSPDYTVLRGTGVAEIGYLNQVLRLPAFRPELAKRAKGIVDGLRRLYTDDLYALTLPLPPLSEQRTILKALEALTSDLVRTVGVAQAEIGLLREYQARLVADVVTGKLDVRAAAATLPQEPLDDPREAEDGLSDEDPDQSDFDTEEAWEEA